MITMSDIIDIMRVFYSPSTTGTSVAAALSELTISAWRTYASSLEVSGTAQISSPDIRRAGEDMRRASAAVEAAASLGATAVAEAAAALARVHPRLIAIDPEDDLLSVSRKLRRHRLHHMPVLDVEQNAVINILSHRMIFSHIFTHFSDERRLFDHSLFSLGVGSFENVVVVPDEASVISVLNVLVERRISAVPVVNATGQVVDVYGREDVGFLANDPSLMVLDAPVGEVRRAQVAMVRRYASLRKK